MGNDNIVCRDILIVILIVHFGYCPSLVQLPSRDWRVCRSWTLFLQLDWDVFTDIWGISSTVSNDFCLFVKARETAWCPRVLASRCPWWLSIWASSCWVSRSLDKILSFCLVVLLHLLETWKRDFDRVLFGVTSDFSVNSKAKPLLICLKDIYNKANHFLAWLKKQCVVLSSYPYSVIVITSYFVKKKFHKIFVCCFAPSAAAALSLDVM